MDQSLQTRINKIKTLIEEFGIEHKKLATYASRSYVTISRTLKGNDERYSTESNVQAIEEGIEKILDEYRQKLSKLDNEK